MFVTTNKSLLQTQLAYLSISHCTFCITANPSVCEPNPCAHGGLCEPWPCARGYICHCPSGFGGHLCEDDLNAPEPEPEPEDQQPAAVLPEGQAPAEHLPEGQAPAEQLPEGQAPVEQNPVEQAPVEQNPVEQQPEQQPIEQQPQELPTRLVNLLKALAGQDALTKQHRDPEVEELNRMKEIHDRREQNNMIHSLTENTKKIEDIEKQLEDIFMK